MDTPTTRAKTVEMERLRVLENQCKKREELIAAYSEEAFISKVEWAQSQGHC